MPERARPTGATAGHTRVSGGEMGPVENEDYVTSLVRFASGARGVLEASRVSVGEQNNYGFEIHGTKGAVFWDFRRMNELGLRAERPQFAALSNRRLAGAGWVMRSWQDALAHYLTHRRRASRSLPPSPQSQDTT